MQFKTITVLMLCIGHVKAQGGLLNMFLDFDAGFDSTNGTDDWSDIPPDVPGSDPWGLPLDSLPVDPPPSPNVNPDTLPGDSLSTAGKPAVSDTTSAMDNLPDSKPVDLSINDQFPWTDPQQDPPNVQPSKSGVSPDKPQSPGDSNHGDILNTGTPAINHSPGQPVDLNTLNMFPWTNDAQDPSGSSPPKSNFLPDIHPVVNGVPHSGDTVNTKPLTNIPSGGLPVNLGNLIPDPWMDNSQNPSISQPSASDLLPDIPPVSSGDIFNTADLINSSPVGQPVKLKNSIVGPSFDTSQDLLSSTVHKDSMHNNDQTFFPVIPPNAVVSDLTNEIQNPFQPVLQNSADKQNTDGFGLANAGIQIGPITSISSDTGTGIWNSGSGGTPFEAKPDIGIPTKSVKDEMEPGRTIGVISLPSDTSFGTGDQHPIPLGPKDAAPLGPFIGNPVDITPHKTESQKDTANQVTGKGRIPVKWMNVYPNGRPQRRKMPVVSDPIPVTMNRTEFRLAQFNLNSFGKNRRLARTYRKQRRDKSRKLRQLRKQQRKQNKKKNNGRGSRGRGSKGAHVAKMIVPRTNKPFVGKVQRGRKSKFTCTSSQKRRGLCSSGRAN